MESQICDSSITFHGFTPVRRRECDINTRQQAEPEKEWTTARCHRLLRALTSRVAVLKKELSLISAATGGSQDANHLGVKEKKPKARPKTGYPYDDVDWTQAKKKIKRTYYGRMGKKSGAPSEPQTPRVNCAGGAKRALIPGEIVVPTPILARARGEQQTRPAVPTWPTEEEQNPKSRRSGLQQLTNEVDSQFTMYGTLKNLRKTVTLSRYATYEGIYNGLETLLRSTNEEPKTKKKGARSMLSMCLRAVPRYIEQEQALESEYEEENGTKSSLDARDISTEIYDNLEQFGTSGNGWKHLRIIVRAHGMKVVKDAIVAGLLDVDFCGALATLCIRNSATEEAESLISSLLSSSSFSAPKTLYDSAPRPLALLWKFVEYTGRSCFQYDQLGSLLFNDKLPLGWLATKDFRPVWIRVMQKLSPGLINEGVLTFLNITLPLLAGASHSDGSVSGPLVAAVESTFSSLLTTLLSITILSAESTDSTDHFALVASAAEREYEHINTLLNSALVQYQVLYPLEQHSVLLLAANLFAKERDDTVPNISMQNFESLIARLNVSTDDPEDEGTATDDLVTFICSVARCCGRGSGGFGFKYLKNLHFVLEERNKDVSDFGGILNVIVESALAFADRAPERKHLEYAAILDAKYSSRNRKTHLNTTNTKSSGTGSGFRWEDGIGEWITATPMIHKQQPKLITESLVMEMEMEEGSYTPFVSTPYLPRGREIEIRIPWKNMQRGSSPSPTNPDLEVPTHEAPEIPNDLKALVDEQMSSDQLQSDVEENGDSDTDAMFSSGSKSAVSEESICSSTSSLDQNVEIYDEVVEQVSRPGKRKLPSTYDCEADDNELVARPHKRKFRSSQDHQSFGNSCISTFSSSKIYSQTTQASKTGSRLARRSIDKLPRVQKRALRLGTLDESDDELSFLPVSLSQDESVTKDITNTVRVRNCNVQKITALRSRKSRRSGGVSPLGMYEDSEDELCI